MSNEITFKVRVACAGAYRNGCNVWINVRATLNTGYGTTDGTYDIDSVPGSVSVFSMPEDELRATRWVWSRDYDHLGWCCPACQPPVKETPPPDMPKIVIAPSAVPTSVRRRVRK